MTDDLARAGALARAPADTTSASDSVASSVAAAAEPLRVYDIEFEIPGSPIARLEPDPDCHRYDQHLGPRSPAGRDHRQASDTTTVSDAAHRLVGITRTASDSVPIGANSVLRVAAAKTRTVSDTTTVSDAVTRLFVGARTATDTTTTTDSLVRLNPKTRAIADTTSVSEALVRRLAAKRSPPTR